MTRATVIRDAKRIGVSTNLTTRRGTAPKATETLRINVLERCYGPNTGAVSAKRMGDLDAMITRIVDCELGKLGYLLSVSLHALRSGNEERAEYLRLTGLKRRRPADEARLLRSSSQWLSIACIAQDLHAVESQLRRSPA
jgi:hypothetical protein